MAAFGDPQTEQQVSDETTGSSPGYSLRMTTACRSSQTSQDVRWGNRRVSRSRRLAKSMDWPIVIDNPEGHPVRRSAGQARLMVLAHGHLRFVIRIRHDRLNLQSITAGRTVPDPLLQCFQATHNATHRTRQSCVGITPCSSSRTRCSSSPACSSAASARATAAMAVACCGDNVPLWTSSKASSSLL